MDAARIDRSLQKLLQQRRLYLRKAEPGQHHRGEETFFVLLDDGHQDGFQVGHVVRVAGGLAWIAYARTNGHVTSQFPGLPNFEAAVHTVIDHAR
jgi:hypothetical protein